MAQWEERKVDEFRVLPRHCGPGKFWLTLHTSWACCRSILSTLPQLYSQNSFTRNSLSWKAHPSDSYVRSCKGFSDLHLCGLGNDTSKSMKKKWHQQSFPWGHMSKVLPVLGNGCLTLYCLEKQHTVSDEGKWADAREASGTCRCPCVL